MSRSKGRIYFDADYGISIDDIAATTGQGSNRDLGSQCQGMSGYESVKNANDYVGAINKWSKAKPTHFTGFVTKADIIGNTPNHQNQQKGENIGYRYLGTTVGYNNPYDYVKNGASRTYNTFKLSYGIEIPSASELYESTSTNPDALTSDIGFTDGYPTSGFLGGLLMDGEKPASHVSTLHWRYLPPLSYAAAGNKICFRILDFHNYNNNAICPLPRVMGILDGVKHSVKAITGNKIQVLIDVILPVHLPAGNITYVELSNDVLSKGAAYAGQNAVGLIGMYLCAILYHAEQNSPEANAEINKVYWQSSPVALGDIQQPTNNWDRIYFEIPVTDTATYGDIGKEGDDLINGTQHDENGDKAWKLKLFYSTHPIELNCLPTLGSDTAYKLIRGYEEAVELKFVLENNAIYHAGFSWAGITRYSSGPNDWTDYGVQAVIHNYTNAPRTCSIVRLAVFHSIGGTPNKPFAYFNHSFSGNAGVGANIIDVNGNVGNNDDIDIVFFVRWTDENSVDHEFGAVIRNVQGGYSRSKISYFNSFAELEALGYDDYEIPPQP